MVTLQSLAELILQPLKQLDDLISIEVVKQQILFQRQRLIKERYEKTRIFNPSLIQAFDVKLNKVSQSKGVVEDKSIFYISDILPKPLLITRSLPFISVTNSLQDTRRKSLGFVMSEELEYIKYRKFTKLGDYYTYENDRLITFNLDKVRIRALWEDPITVKEFSTNQDIKLNCGTSTLESPCFVDDDLVIEESIAGIIQSIILGHAQTTSRDDRETGNSVHD